MRAMERIGRPVSRADLTDVTISSGQFFTDEVSVRLGGYITRLALRLGVHPSVLTLLGLATAVISGFALALADRGWGVQVVAVAGFQLAYLFDCADGQVARLSGTTSRAGAELDVLVDTAAQWTLVAATVVVAARQPSIEPVVIGLFAASWTLSIITTLMARLRVDTWESASLRATSLPVLLSRQVRDYPLSVLVLTSVACWSPARALGWLLGAFALLNVGIVSLHIASRARGSLGRVG